MGTTAYRAGWALLIGLLLGLGLSSAAAAGRDVWHFRVYLDGDAIGYHDFAVIDQGAVRRVETEARFTAKFLFFTAYTYHTQGTSRWRGNCLVRLDSRTDDNGDAFHITGELRRDHFHISTGSDETDLPPCIMSFAYWNPAILAEPRLLNTQTGNYIDVETTALGPERIDVHGQPRRALHYILHASNKAIELWYSPADKHWLRLKTTVRDGKELLYRLQPPATGQPQPRR